MHNRFWLACGLVLLACHSSSGATPPPTLTISVQHQGGPGGVVTSEPAGLTCTADGCTGSFPSGTVITLTEDPETARFVRWGGIRCSGNQPTCTLRLDQDVGVQATFLAANYAFVTSRLYDPTFASLEAADAICQERAAAASLPGTYRAWLSTSAADARDRLGTARGWVRPDGLPFADSVSSLLDDRQVFFPASLDEFGAAAGSGVFTGTGADGRSDPGNDCDGWRTNGSNFDVLLGATDGGEGAWTEADGGSCDAPGHLRCFGVDVAQPVALAPASGRSAFVTKALMNGATTVAGFDAQCAAEATAAGLSGVFLAGIADDGHSMESRLDLTGARWVRTDGVPLADPDALARLIAPITQHADGTPSLDAYAWSGCSAPALPGTAETTCSSWGSASTGQSGDLGRIGVASLWFDATTGTCDELHPVYCFQRQ